MFITSFEEQNITYRSCSNLRIHLSERGYSVTDVAERLGVSQHSIYKWLKAVQPLRNNPDEHELLEAKKEILRLKSQLKQTEEERDILKKAARYFASLPE